MKSIFLKNGISLFGALLLIQASFCSDRSIDSAIDQFINGGQSETTKRKNSASDNRMSKQKKVNPAISKEGDSNVDLRKVDQIMEYLKSEQESRFIESEREDQLKLKKLLLEVLPSVLNDFKKKPSCTSLNIKYLDLNLLRVLMAAAIKIDPFAELVNGKTLYAAIVDAACTCGFGASWNSHSWKDHEHRWTKEKFFNLYALFDSFDQNQKLKGYMDCMNVIWIMHSRLFGSKDHIISMILCIIYQNVSKDQEPCINKKLFNKDDRKKGERKSIKSWKEIWNTYCEVRTEANFMKRMYDVIDSIAESWNSPKQLHIILSNDCLVEAFSDIDSITMDESKIVSPNYINQLKELGNLVSQVDLAQKWNGRTPCCYILEKFVKKDITYLPGENTYNADPSVYQIANLQQAIEFVRKHDPDQTQLTAIINQMEKYEKAYADAEQDLLLIKIQATRFLCLAEILCNMFQRYFKEYPSDPKCIYMQRYCWPILDNNLDDDIEKPQDTFALKIRGNELMKAKIDGICDYKDLRDQSGSITVYYDKPLELIKEERNLFQKVRDAVKRPDEYKYV